MWRERAPTNIYIVRTHSIVSFLAFCLPRLWSLSFVAFSLSFLGAFFLLSLAGFHQFLPVKRTSPLLLLLIHSATPPEKVKLLLLLWCLLLEYFGIGEEAFWWLSTSSRTWHLNSIYCWHSDNFPPPWFSCRQQLLHPAHTYRETWFKKEKIVISHFSANFNLPVFWNRTWFLENENKCYSPICKLTSLLVEIWNVRFFQGHKPICEVRKFQVFPET